MSNQYKYYKHPEYSYVHILEIPFSQINKIDFALCNQPTETPDSYYKRQSIKPDIITNGGFFSMSNGVTCFGLTDEFNKISVSNYYGVGITDNKNLIYSKSQSLFRDFISAYPPLIVNGSKSSINYAKELDYNARRTCIGWNSDNYYIVAVDSPGLNYKSLQSIFLELNADYAINLDGGGSTRLLIDGDRKTSQIYARPVDNVMCIYLNKPVSRTIYRVQVGAFLFKNNANNLLNELRYYGYNDAYITKVGLYYKVQVGAFSVKLNAERLKDKLTALGYKPFISTHKT